MDWKEGCAARLVHGLRAAPPDAAVHGGVTDCRSVAGGRRLRTARLRDARPWAALCAAPPRSVPAPRGALRTARLRPLSAGGAAARSPAWRRTRGLRAARSSGTPAGGPGPSAPPAPAAWTWAPAASTLCWRCTPPTRRSPSPPRPASTTSPSMRASSAACSARAAAGVPPLAAALPPGAPPAAVLRPRTPSASSASAAWWWTRAPSRTRQAAARHGAGGLRVTSWPGCRVRRAGPGAWGCVWESERFLVFYYKYCGIIAVRASQRCDLHAILYAKLKTFGCECLKQKFFLVWVPKHNECLAASALWTQISLCLGFPEGSALNIVSVALYDGWGWNTVTETEGKKKNSVKINCRVAQQAAHVCIKNVYFIFMLIRWDSTC